LLVDSQYLVERLVVISKHVSQDVRELFLLAAEVSGLEDDSLVLAVVL
jgi:hypothetical protein